MTEFANMWKNYVNFSARTTKRGYWMAFLIYFVLAIVVSIISTATDMTILSTIFSLATFLPLLAMGVRRLRDAGRGWGWILVPIVNIIFLCGASVPDDGTPVV